MALEKYNFIIVGGGIAGLVLAARLSEDPHCRILVLEAGQEYRSDHRFTTPGLWSSLIGTDADWKLRTVPQKALGNRGIVFPLGCALGGSGAINGSAFIAPSKEGVDAWEQLGNQGWNWASLSQYFKKVFTLTMPPEPIAKHLGLDYVDESSLSAKGPIQISFPHDAPEDSIWTRAWLDTWGEKGLSMSTDPFSGQAHGAYITAESIDPYKKQRSYAANTYMVSARERENVSVITGVLVEKVLFDRSNPDDVVVTGVKYSKGGESHTVTAHEVILAAGAINSPRLLEASGVGGAQLLQKYDIPIVVDNPNVGENLQNHPLVSISLEVNDNLETLDGLVRQEATVLHAATESYAKQTGPLANGAVYSAAMLPFANTEREDMRQEIERLLNSPVAESSPASTVNTAFLAAHSDFVHSVLRSRTTPSGVFFTFPGYAIPAIDESGTGTPDGNYLTLMHFLSYPLSRGSTHIASSSALGAVSIDPNYYSHPLDLEILARQFIYFVTTVTQPTSPLGKLLKPKGRRNPGAEKVEESLETAKEYVKKITTIAAHTVGTCAMLPREKGGVVDEKLQVYGVRGLRVCDASIIPIIPQGNPQATVYAVAEKGADVIKGTAKFL